MLKVKNKKITLDGLATMVKRGFDSMEQKFDKMFAENKKEHEQIFQKLDSLERRVIYIEDVITQQTKEIREIKSILIKHTNMLEKHSKELKEIRKELEVLQTQKEPLEEKVELLEQRVSQLETQILNA